MGHREGVALEPVCPPPPTSEIPHRNPPRQWAMGTSLRPPQPAQSWKVAAMPRGPPWHPLPALLAP